MFRIDSDNSSENVSSGTQILDGDIEIADNRDTRSTCSKSKALSESNYEP